MAQRNGIPIWRRNLRAALIAAGTLTIGAIVISAAQRSVFGGEPSERIDRDGTLHVSTLRWPPSDYWTSAFAKAYEEHMVSMLSAPANFGVPAMSAPRGEWARFDAAAEQALGQIVTRDLSRFRVTKAEMTIGGIRAAVLTPKDGVAVENARRILVNLHGFAHGLSEGEVESIPIASLGRIKVVTLDYRLEPYFRYPASSQDVEAAYRALIKEYRPEAIGLFGSSGGGVLVAQVVAWLQAKELPRPGAVGIFWSGLATAPFPWGKSGDSGIWGFRTFPSDDQSEVTKLNADLAAWYLRDVADNDSQAYPGSSDVVLGNFPPTLFMTGTRAIDMSPAIVGHARLLRLNVDSSLYVIEGGWHGSNISEMQETPEQIGANAYVARWFKQHLKQ